MKDDFQSLETERINAGSADMDAVSTGEMLRMINREDQKVAIAVASEIPAIARAVDAVAARLSAGGRLRSFGAGTSGRIAILDASEMSPTFGVPRDLVEGHMAGGPNAFYIPEEGAEDDEDAGGAAVRALAISAADAVIGLSASGRTPYVAGVLKQARQTGAATIGIACVRPSPVLELAEIPVGVIVGPEVLAGSTRMKAGTAQKLVLNMITTGAMVRLGLTYGNLMVGVAPSNEKLRARALRLVATVTGGPPPPTTLMEEARWDVRVASLMIAGRMDAGSARAALERARGSLRGAMRDLGIR